MERVAFFFQRRDFAVQKFVRRGENREPASKRSIVGRFSFPTRGLRSGRYDRCFVFFRHGRYLSRIIAIALSRLVPPLRGRAPAILRARRLSFWPPPSGGARRVEVNPPHCLIQGTLTSPEDPPRSS